MKTEVIECSVKYRPKDILYDDCKIVIENSEYWLIISGNVRPLTLQSRVWNDSSQYYLYTDFEIVSAQIDKRTIHVNIGNSLIIDIKGNSHKMCLKIDRLSYGYCLISSYFLSPISKALVRHMFDYELSLSYGQVCFNFKYDTTLETVRVEFSNNGTSVEKILHELLNLISFYLRVPLEVWIKETQTNGQVKREYCRPKYRAVLEESSCNNLDYVLVNNQFLSLTDFVNTSQFLQSDIVKKNIVKRGIERYIASNYLDDISKFIYLVSIIHTFAEKVHDFSDRDASMQVDKLLSECQIDSAILNKGIEFTSLRRNSKNTFVEVRNEIMHALPSPEIEQLIDELELVRKVDFASLIIILHELGFSDIRFCDDFESLNILKER